MFRDHRTAAFSEFESADLAARAAADLFVRLAAEALRQRDVFCVALAGGASFRACHRLLAEPLFASKVDWEKVEVFFGDERCVPAGRPGRNDAAAEAELLSRVPVPRGNVHRIDAAAPDAAERYEAKIRKVVGRRREGGTAERIPSFDLIFLGLGPDGHTASLFPGHRSLEEEERLVLRVTGSPKPPPSRVTFTLPLINAARCVVFLVTGTDKAEAYFAARAGQRNVPAGHVRPLFGSLHFLADRAATAVWRSA